MGPSASTRLRVGLVALLVMWLASVAQEPGGLTAFASEMASVEQQITATTGAAAVHLDEKLDQEASNDQVEYFDGVLCDKAPPVEAGQPAPHRHCETVMDVDGAE